MSHAYATTPLIEQTRRDEQERLARAHNGPIPHQRSTWVIETLKDRLEPDHVALAKRLLSTQAQAEGIHVSSRERVDGAGNGAETALIARLDAQRMIAGYEAAIRHKLARAGFLCLRAVVEGDGFTELMRRCGFLPEASTRPTRGQRNQAVEIVQLTMHVAADYRDLCESDRSAWNARA